MERWLFLILMVLLAMVIFAPKSNAANIFSTLGMFGTNMTQTVLGGTPSQRLNGGV